MNKNRSSKLILAVSTLCIFSGSTFAENYSQPKDLKFQVNNSSNSKLVTVIRDNKFCQGDNYKSQKCPVDLYIDNVKSGTFFINNTAKYNLNNNIYNFKVKNCTKDCIESSYNFDISNNNNFILSVDKNGKPFIIRSQKIEQKTDIINLQADALFKFNGSSLNDLLPEGKASLERLSSDIRNKYININNIRLTGHTDRLGGNNYNYNLGLSRAETVKNYLVNIGLPENIFTTESSGPNNPVTDGCFNNKGLEKTKLCLSPDRRVTVNIKGYIQK